MDKFIESSNGIHIPVNLIKFFGIDTFFFEEKDFIKVDKHTRAGKKGKTIRCPHCRKFERVYNFAWCAATCPKCKKDINKYDYYVFHEPKEK